MAPPSNTFAWDSGKLTLFIGVWLNLLLLDVHLDHFNAVPNDFPRLVDCVNHRRRNGWLFYSWQQ